MIDLGDYGHPPSTRRRDYPLVLLQLMQRMRLELLLLLTIAVLINSDVVPRGQTANANVVRLLGIAARTPTSAAAQ